jgi:hypothetical protein
MLPERPQQPPREDPRDRQQQQPPPPREDLRRREPPPVGPDAADDNPFLLPNERDRMPVYGAAPPMPVVPMALMVLAIVVGGALFYLSQSDKAESGITPQQAANNLILHMDGLDITETAFRRDIATGVAKGRVQCDRITGQPADNIAAGLRLGVLKMEVPNASGIVAKKDQKADDASLLIAAQIVLDACPKGAAPAPAQQQPQTNPPGGQPIPSGTQAAPPPGGQPIPTGTQAPPPAGGTPRPASPGAGPIPTPRP